DMAALFTLLVAATLGVTGLALFSECGSYRVVPATGGYQSHATRCHARCEAARARPTGDKMTGQAARVGEAACRVRLASQPRPGTKRLDQAGETEGARIHRGRQDTRQLAVTACAVVPRRCFEWLTRRSGALWRGLDRSK